jgi:glutaredoxin
MKTILIYSMPGCVACNQLATLFDRKEVAYKKVDIYEDNEAMNVMRDFGLRSVPQVFLDVQDTYVHVGDHSKLKTFTDEQWEALK